jgi:molecular chaperone GrpE (heat shock protein)
LAAQQERGQLLEALAQQAVFIAQFAMVLDRYEAAFTQLQAQGSQPSPARAHRSLRILKDKMLSALSSHEIDIDIPLGKPYDEVAEVVTIEGWRHSDDYPSEVVVEVMEPIVRHKGTLLHSGRVIMGAPMASNTETIS